MFATAQCGNGEKRDPSGVGGCIGISGRKADRPTCAVYELEADPQVRAAGSTTRNVEPCPTLEAIVSSPR